MKISKFFNLSNKKQISEDAMLNKLKGYKIKHLEECKFLWQNKVPKTGQANTVQGELLRQIEKLRIEACDNGNINWCNDFSFFCNFIEKTLSEFNCFDAEKIELIHAVLEKIESCGEYARNYTEGKLLESELMIDNMAYTEDDLYDFISDAIAEFAIKNPDDILYEKNKSIHH